MTTQEAYEKIREHFTQPGADLARLGDADDYNPSNCVYRLNGDASSKVRCAFGVLIPDEFYHPDMEGRSSESVLELHDLPDLEDVDSRFIGQAQDTHDGASSLEEFVRFLDDLARDEYGLKVPA